MKEAIFWSVLISAMFVPIYAGGSAITPTSEPVVIADDGKHRCGA